MQRLSRFENIADFPRANGMCSFRDWYHFQNTTADAAISMPYVRSVSDRLVLRTDRAEVESLEALGVLRTLSHQCDRSYAHTDHKACFFSAAKIIQDDAHLLPQPILAARTWSKEDGVWNARFCAQQNADVVTGFLSPYQSATLHSAARDVMRCSKLGFCPSTSFYVRGREVENRRVRVHVLSVDSPGNVRAENAARDYCGLDAQRCWGMGQLLGVDCADVALETSALCVVDLLLLPLLHVAYNMRQPAPRTNEEFASRLTVLRQSCPHAFTDSMGGLKDTLLFQDVYEHLTEPYSWSDSSRRQIVLEYSNSLGPLLFGVLTARGIESVEQYLLHAECATFLARALIEHEQSFANINELSFYHSSSTGNPNEPAMPVLPGSSLYLIDRRLPISINLRWLFQCVVLAKDSKEGGVVPGFLKQLNTGTLSRQHESVDCENYRHSAADTSTLQLGSWLRKAKFLFTQQEAAELHPLQITTDVFGSIRRAVAQLPVLDMPDLVCVTSEKGWTQQSKENKESKSVFENNNALLHLHRFRNPALSFGVGQKQTSVDITKRIFADADGISIDKQVLQFLVRNTKRSADSWNAQTSLTLQQLESDGVLINEHIFKNDVMPRDMYPRYTYTNLRKLSTFYTEMTVLPPPSLKTYTAEDTPPSLCSCSRDELQQHRSLCIDRRRLAKPEYSLSAKINCAGLRSLPCNAAGVQELVDNRNWMDPPYLTQDEMLYLTLLIFEYEISYTTSGGFTTLHRLKDTEKSQFVDELFAVPLPRENDRLSLHESRQFNDFLEQQDVSSIKCPATDLDFSQETNKRHQQMRLCRDSLREKIGWRINKTAILALQPPASSILRGFYLTHMQPPDSSFLDKLFDTPWADAQYSTYESAICSVRQDATEVMAPFWAEYFDVGSQDSPDAPSLACDYERSGKGSMLMVYNTLCASSMSSLSARTCSEHPQYRQHLEHSMPAACARQDGKVVVRRRTGALAQGSLCDLVPEGQGQACALKHGALNAHTGEHAENLNDMITIQKTQSGFWSSANSVFRGQQTDKQLTALAIDDLDIAGHCLGFSINALGTLTLRSAALSTKCDTSKAALLATDVRLWLADVEQEWAWDHAHSQAVHASNEAQVAASSVAWTCPLHWLQQYHDDDGRHQARSPSWQRNAARFAHITGEHHYAHPTVRHANRIRGLRAARFLADGLACVAAPELCHGETYLNKTLSDILQPAWRPVAYVPELHPECNRTLDWPVDCGKARPDRQMQEPGECVLRN
jgi:hypothetical protein